MSLCVWLQVLTCVWRVPCSNLGRNTGLAYRYHRILHVFQVSRLHLEGVPNTGVLVLLWAFVLEGPLSHNLGQFSIIKLALLPTRHRIQGSVSRRANFYLLPNP